MEKKFLFSAVMVGVVLSVSAYKITGNNSFVSQHGNVEHVASVNNAVALSSNTIVSDANGTFLNVSEDTVLLMTEENVNKAIGEKWVTNNSATYSTTKRGTIDPATGEPVGEATVFPSYLLKGQAKYFTTNIVGVEKLIAYGVTGSSTDTRVLQVRAVSDDGETISASGESAPATTTVVELNLNANKRYFVSYYGYDLSGAGGDVALQGVKFVAGGQKEAKWIDVELVSAGSLGVEVLYKVDVLSDVDYLRVKGTLNATDWETIKQMTNLRGIDLRETKFDKIPDKAFDSRSLLTTVYLPEGMTSIGQYSFRKTSLEEITIPSTVTMIGQHAFRDIKTLKKFEFAEDSKLQTIPEYMFYNCSNLTLFKMPNSVTSVGDNAFQDCTSLSNLTLSSALTVINRNAFLRTKSLKNVEFPQGLKTIEQNAFSESGLESACLPVGLTSLGSSTFSSCDSLKMVELPAYVPEYSYTFYCCRSLKKVICHSATPPYIPSGDPFYDVNKSNVTLVVPNFAVVNYKLDSFWYQFGKIEGGVVSDYWKITAPLSLTNNRRMDGNPDIDLYYNGQLTVGGNAPMELRNMNIFVNDNTPGQLINTCNAMTADGVTTIYTVEANKWYFITPLHDVSMTDIEHSAGASFVFRYYDAAGRAANGPGSSWKNVTDENLVAGQGYIFQCNKAGTISLPANAESIVKTMNPDDVVMPLSVNESENTANQNWNYVGNPYPCHYDIYYMDFTAPITVWDMNSRTYKVYSLVDDNFILKPMQAFFVQKPDNVDNITFGKEGRQMDATVNRPSSAPARYARGGADRILFNVKVSDGEMSDETRVVINSQASADYEMECDASKFMSMSTDVPQIYTVDAAGNSLAINERPMLDGKVDLGLYVAKSGYHTISLGRADGDIDLYDAVAGRKVCLNDGEYTFYVEEPGVMEGRFVLMPHIDNSTDGIGNVSAADINVAAGNGMLHVTAPNNSAIQVFGTDGKLLTTATAVSGTADIQLPAGVYVVKVNNLSVKRVVY